METKSPEYVPGFRVWKRHQQGFDKAKSLWGGWGRCGGGGRAFLQKGPSSPPPPIFPMRNLLKGLAFLRGSIISERQRRTILPTD